MTRAPFTPGQRVRIASRFLEPGETARPFVVLEDRETRVLVVRCEVNPPGPNARLEPCEVLPASILEVMP